MKKVSANQMKSAMSAVARLIVEKEPYLTEIDTVIGDGDHGFGMKTGFGAVEKMFCQSTFEYVDDVMKAVGMELIKTMGGASGVIFGTMFIGGLKELGHEKEADALQIANFFAEGEKAIERSGKARPGQKTLIDALVPAAQEMRQVALKGGDIKEMFGAAYEGAMRGVEASKSMQSRVGRSKNFRDATIGLPDPGAVSTSLIFKALFENLE